MLEQVRDFLQLTETELKEEAILKRKDSVFYLVLNRKGNAFNKEFVRAINRQLDIVNECKGMLELPCRRHIPGDCVHGQVVFRRLGPELCDCSRTRRF